MKPLVSISCISYNHAPYIKQCLDGFVMQKTNFPFEVLIHDDASTDGTEEIIREYEKKYPEIIKPLYETENQWVKGRAGSIVFNFPRAQGKYIAMCEGDDYWTDSLKLQKQVDFLKTNLKFGGVCSNRIIVDKKNTVTKQEKNKSFSVHLLDVLIGEVPGTQTLLFEKDTIKNIAETQEICDPYSAITGDKVIAYEVCKHKPIFHTSETYAAYRVSNSGVWSKQSEKEKEEQIFYANYYLNLLFSSKHRLKFFLSLHYIKNALKTFSFRHIFGKKERKENMSYYDYPFYFSLALLFLFYRKIKRLIENRQYRIK